MQQSVDTEGEVSMNKLAEDFKLVVQDAESLIKATAGEIGDKLGDKAREARNRLVAQLDSVKTKYRDWEGKAVEGAKAADHVIRDHPYESVGIAFGVGLVLGVLASRR